LKYEERVKYTRYALVTLRGMIRRIELEKIEIHE
jgi:hypothetical protein